MTIYNAFTIAMKRYQEVVNDTRHSENRSSTTDSILNASVLSFSFTSEFSSQNKIEFFTDNSSETLSTFESTSSFFDSQVSRQFAISFAIFNNTSIFTSVNENILKKKFMNTIKKALNIENTSSLDQAIEITAR